MSNNISLEAIIKIIAYGVPALLILLGFIAYTSGSAVQMITGNVEMKNVGLAMIVVGIIIYVIELVVYIWGEYGR